MAADKRGGPFLEPNRVEATDVAGPTGYHPVTAYAPSDEQTAEGFRRIWDLLRQARRSAWLKGWHADLLDGRHAPYLTTAVNEVDVDHPDLNDSTPATPTGGLNVKWQASATKNSSDQTPVSAYVPFATLSTATIVGTDHVVITDTSDSDNPKRGLVSDITALVSAAPPDATYVTLTTNATLTNERTLAVGTGLDLTDGGAGNAATIDVDLNELTTATAVAADHLIFVDNDDTRTKKTTMADALVALGAAPSATATVAAASIADNVAVRGDGGSRGVQGSAFVINDVSGTNLTLTADGTVTGTLALKPADTLAVSTGPSLSLDAAQGSATPGTALLGTTNAEAVSIGRTGKNTTIRGSGRVNQMAHFVGAFAGAAGDDVAVGAVSCFRVTSGSTLTGMVPAAGGTAVDGQLMVVVNETGGNITLSHDTTSAAANRLLMAGGANLTISRYSAALFRYSTSDSRWRHVGEAGGGTGGGINEGVSAGLNFWGAW